MAPSVGAYGYRGELVREGGEGIEGGGPPWRRLWAPDGRGAVEGGGIPAGDVHAPTAKAMPLRNVHANTKSHSKRRAKGVFT